MVTGATYAGYVHLARMIRNSIGSLHWSASGSALQDTGRGHLAITLEEPGYSADPIALRCAENLWALIACLLRLGVKLAIRGRSLPFEDADTHGTLERDICHPIQSGEGPKEAHNDVTIQLFYDMLQPRRSACLNIQSCSGLLGLHCQELRYDNSRRMLAPFSIINFCRSRIPLNAWRVNGDTCKINLSSTTGILFRRR